MCAFLDPKALLRAIPQENRPHVRFDETLHTFLAPKLHTDVSEGYCVRQGDAAISKYTLLTGGLATCTAIVMASPTHNFVCHVDSHSKPEWIAACIKTFVQLAGQPIEVARFNCHGRGLNGPAERVSREALLLSGHRDRCVDFQDGITGMHSVGAKMPGSTDLRIFSRFGKLK